MNNSSGTTSTDIESRNFKNKAQRNAPSATVFYFLVHVKNLKSSPYKYSATIYPKKGENESTAWERVEKVSSIAYMNVEKIEFVKMQES
jgi:hypothetical protein